MMKPPQTLFLEDLIEKAMKRAEDSGVEDFAGKGVREKRVFIRFSNNRVTVSEYLDISTLSIYLGCKKRRVTAEFENVNEKDFMDELDGILKTIDKVEPYEHYVGLPKGKIDYELIPGLYDAELAEKETTFTDAVEEAINSALDEGASRVSGVLSVKNGRVFLLTSGGRRGEYRYSKLGLNVRAFSGEGISGQWANISTSLRNLRCAEIGGKAGRLATASKRQKLVEPGRYNVLFSPIVAANFLNSIVSATSAFYVDLGLSMFIDKIGEEVADEKLTVVDDPLMEGNPGGKPFDDEGTPTERVEIIGRGVLRTFLHNSTTARKFGSKTTGHAGIIVPEAHSLIVEPGELREEEMLKELGDGLYITNNWYLRFNNYISGEFSTMVRDAAFNVKNGEITHLVKGARISDSMSRLIKSIRLIGREREWIKWWEVKTPSLIPHLMVSGVNITTGYR